MLLSVEETERRRKRKEVLASSGEWYSHPIEKLASSAPPYWM
jgi:hypothetical protein